ncbi:MAG: anti-sigma factor [Burkholderiaceae bacterium]|jgi:anti-sigma factor RsiW|nr:anti-sigma factor [Burkholderiaceae bacterium]
MTPAFHDDTLHAYVDDALSADERAAVEAHLASHPQDAARVDAWRAQNDALHALFDPVLAEPHALRVAAASRAFGARSAWALAASLVLGVAIGAAGHAWIAPQLSSARQPMPIARQAALAHAAYVPEVRHPVEVGAQEEQHLIAWLSKRLAAPLKAPDLQGAGFRLLGGRLLPTTGELGDAPVALLMYENAQGKRLTLLVRRAADSGDTAFRFATQGGTQVFYWIDGPFGYALAGDIGRDELGALARRVYQQLNP